MQAFISIGSNLGEREKNIESAIKYLQQVPGITVTKQSSLIETAPQGGPPQGSYLNGVIKIEAELSAEDLLSRLQNIENKLGRVRTVKNGPRIIDLDIILYGEEMINKPYLKVPHPRMFERQFVLKPLFEIEPDIKTLIDTLKEKSRT